MSACRLQAGLQRLDRWLRPAISTVGHECRHSVKFAKMHLGELVLVGAPGELITELGLRVKQEGTQITGAPHVVVGGLADQWISYILSDKEYRQGGYEASVSFYGPKLGETIVTGMLRGLGHLESSGETASR